MDTRPKRKPVNEMTPQELLHELIYGDDVEVFLKETKQKAKYLDGFYGLYGK
jgi:hypothetical protein